MEVENVLTQACLAIFTLAVKRKNDKVHNGNTRKLVTKGTSRLADFWSLSFLNCPAKNILYVLHTIIFDHFSFCVLYFVFCILYFRRD